MKTLFSLAQQRAKSFFPLTKYHRYCPPSIQHYRYYSNPHFNESDVSFVFHESQRWLKEPLLPIRSSKPLRISSKFFLYKKYEKETFY
jgi:hypothetical protein